MTTETKSVYAWAKENFEVLVHCHVTEAKDRIDIPEDMEGCTHRAVIVDIESIEFQGETTDWYIGGVAYFKVTGDEVIFLNDYEPAAFESTSYDESLLDYLAENN